MAAAQPLKHGLAELIAYLGLASEDPTAVIDEERREVLTWEDVEGCLRRASVPLVIFARPASLAPGPGAAS